MCKREGEKAEFATPDFKMGREGVPSLQGRSPRLQAALRRFFLWGGGKGRGERGDVVAS